MKKAFEKIYDEFLENDTEMESEEVRQSYSDMHDVFENYLCAVQEDLFHKAFEFGYAKGMEAAGKKKTA